MDSACLKRSYWETGGTDRLQDLQQTSGEVVKFYVQEGDLVHKGDTLVIMHADIGAKLAQAEAAHSAAQAMEDEANNGARKQQIQAAYEIWQKSIAGVDIAQKHSNVSANCLRTESFRLRKRRAQAQCDAAKATEKAAKAQYDMAVEGARVEDKEAARAQVSRANEPLLKSIPM